MVVGAFFLFPRVTTSELGDKATSSSIGGGTPEWYVYPWRVMAEASGAKKFRTGSALVPDCPPWWDDKENTN